VKARLLPLLCLASVCLLLLSTRGSSGEVKAELLVGKWEFVEVPADNIPKGSIGEFTKDGKAILTFKKDGETVKKEAKYKVEGNKLFIIEKENQQEPAIIKTLTKTDLVVEDPKGRTFKLKRKAPNK
jgi:uncharacterized protein (TIGR03066 family)